MRTGKSLPGREKRAADTDVTASSGLAARRGRSARRIGVAAVLAAATIVVLAGCGVRPSGVISGVPAPSGPVVPEASNSTKLYFLMGSQPTASQRQRTRTEPADVLALLAAGPDDDERAAGLTTQVPANAAPVSVEGAPSGVTVTLGTDVSALSTVATEQIACTLRHQDSAASVPPITLIGGGHSRGPLACPF
jgi:hypothetical protein